MKKIALILALAACVAGALCSAEIPRLAPELMIPLPGGKQAKLSDYAGHVVIVTFMLST